MASDFCEYNRLEQGGDCSKASTEVPTYPGDDFFKDFSELLSHNPTQLNYGVSVTDIDADGRLEAVVAGFGAANLAYQWDSDRFVDVAQGKPLLQDATHKAIGVAACDVDGDGYEELYILNTDSYSGTTQTSDRLMDIDAQGESMDLFAQPQNSGNYVAGRSCACVDWEGTGRYGVMVANYGGPMKLFKTESGNVIDSAPELGMDKTTGGRALIGGPLVSNRFDVFANNEGYGRRLSERRLGHRPNFFFVHTSDGYVDAAEALGILDADYTGRGTTVLDANGDGLLDIVYGNWQGVHRLFLQEEDSEGCVRFVDKAPEAMKVPSNIRTVITADFDNDGYEEIFWNNIPGSNRLFRKLPTDSDWVRINIGEALETDGYGTGAAVGDFDGDGMLELFVSHGESKEQPMSYYRPALGASNHWLRIFPLTQHGAPARGALVTLVMTSGRKQLRVIDPGSGYLCQQEPVAHFGLGQDSSVQSVTIRWPDGLLHTIASPAVDQLHKVSRPADGQVEPAHDIRIEGNCLRRGGSASGATGTGSEGGSGSSMATKTSTAEGVAWLTALTFSAGLCF